MGRYQTKPNQTKSQDIYHVCLSLMAFYRVHPADCFQGIPLMHKLGLIFVCFLEIVTCYTKTNCTTPGLYYFHLYPSPFPPSLLPATVSSQRDAYATVISRFLLRILEGSILGLCIVSEGKLRFKFRSTISK